MALKQLKIKGFKSFADTVKIDFDPGITAIVGPNGCGKSNIVDSFIWAFGEQSAKLLRGSKMPDVIFSGTSDRKPLNMAEVTVTLDNEKGLFASEFSEIAVTRRLYRNGESQYLLNGTQVRLRDIHGLLLDTGLGKDSFSIFEQGKIDQVINLNPLERRYIFEEAAGILRFLQRKHEALKKLELADQNTQRVNDIHREVEQRIILLEKQAEEAKRYKAAKKRLEFLEKCGYVLRWDALHRRELEAIAKTDNTTDSIRNQEQKLQELQAELLAAKQALKEMEEVLQKKREELYQSKSARHIKSKEREAEEGRIAEALKREKQLELESAALQQKQADFKSEKEGLEESKRKSAQLLYTSELQVDKQKQVVQALETDLSVLREQQQALQRDLLQKMQVQNQTESTCKQEQMRHSTLSASQSTLQAKESQLRELRTQLQEQLKQQDATVKDSTAHVVTQKSKFEALDQELSRLSKEIDALNETLNGVKEQLHTGKARFQSLSRLKEDFEGFSKGVKKLLQESANKKSALHGLLLPLHEYLLDDEEMTPELALLLRPYAQTLVVETFANLERVLDFTKQEGIRDFSLLCLEAGYSKAETPKKPLKAFTKIKGVLKQFTDGSGIAKTAEEAIKGVADGLADSIAAADGFFVDAKGVLFSYSQNESNVFLRQAELKTLEKELPKLEQEFAALEAKAKDLQQQRTSLQQKRMEQDKALRRDEMKLVEATFTLQKLSGELERAENELKALDGQKESLTSQLGEVAELIKSVTAKAEEAKAAAQAAQTHAGQASHAIDTHYLTLKTERQKLTDYTVSFQKLHEESRKTAHALHVLDIKDAEAVKQLKRLHDELQSSYSLRKQLAEKTDASSTLLRDLDERLKVSEETTLSLEQSTKERAKALEKIEASIQEILARLKKMEQDKYQSSVQSAQAQSSLKALENDLEERYQLTIETARPCLAEETLELDAIEKESKSLKQQLQQNDSVNLASIEDFEEQKTRYSFLNEQLDDLNGSRQELIQIIAELDEESRKIFTATFEAIRVNFKKNFQILFNGGEADLEFTESADILQAGIDIIAKPPGKQMRSISLLSGGEKCLTAMALLFAIFEIKPAPFCILDEIDAPLDDINVDRFLRVVRQFGDRCQFLIITHNKRTMALADRLFGISMEEKGVSKLLLMEFDQQTVTAAS